MFIFPLEKSLFASPKMKDLLQVSLRSTLTCIFFYQKSVFEASGSFFLWHHFNWLYPIPA